MGNFTLEAAVQIEVEGGIYFCSSPYFTACIPIIDHRETERLNFTHSLHFRPDIPSPIMCLHSAFVGRGVRSRMELSSCASSRTWSKGQLYLVCQQSSQLLLIVCLLLAQLHTYKDAQIDLLIPEASLPTYDSTCPRHSPLVISTANSGEWKKTIIQCVSTTEQ